MKQNQNQSHISQEIKRNKNQSGQGQNNPKLK